MIRKTIISLSGIGLLAAFAVPASAQFSLPENLVVLQDWQFNDADGTGTSEAANAIAGGSSFDVDIHDTETTGDGVLRVARDGSPFAAFAPATLPASGTAYLVVDLAAWNANLEGRAHSRFGFHHTDGDGGGASNMVTEMSFEREVNHVKLALFTTGPGGVNLGREEVSAIPVASSDPIRFVMEYDIDALESRLYYSLDGAPFVQYIHSTAGGVATVSADRAGAGVEGELLRLSFFSNPAGVAQGFGGGQHIDIDRIFVAVPEPSTYALLAGLGVLGLALWRRRRS